MNRGGCQCSRDVRLLAGHYEQCIRTYWVQKQKSQYSWIFLSLLLFLIFLLLFGTNRVWVLGLQFPSCCAGCKQQICCQWVNCWQHLAPRFHLYLFTVWKMCILENDTALAISSSQTLSVQTTTSGLLLILKEMWWIRCKFWSYKKRFYSKQTDVTLDVPLSL